MEKAISTSSAGRAGEEIVGSLLASEGWDIVARNFKAGPGEIDIIAQKGNLLAFIEVKRWKRNGAAELSTSIGRNKKFRIIETSKIFLAKYRQYNGKHIRYDVFLLSSDRMPTRYEGAFDDTL
jgi:putative endonuclease